MHNHSVQLILMGLKLLILLWLRILHYQAVRCWLMLYVPVFLFALHLFIKIICIESKRIRHIYAVAELGSVVIETFKSYNQNPGHYSK